MEEQSGEKLTVKEKIITFIIVAFLLGIILAFVSGCASLSKNAGHISRTIGDLTAEMETLHMNSVDERLSVSKDIIDMMMYHEIYPTRIAEWIEEGTFAEDMCEHPKTRQGKASKDSVEAVREFAIDIVKECEAIRAEALRDLRKIARKKRKEIRERYGEIKFLSNRLTSNLESVLKYKEFRKGVLEAAGVPMDKVDMIQKATEDATEAMEKAIKKRGVKKALKSIDKVIK